MSNGLVQDLGALKKLPNTWNVSPFEEVIKDSSGGNKKTLKSDFLDSGEFVIVDQGQEKIAGYTNNKDLLVKVPPPYVVFGDHTRIFKYIDVPFAMGADGTKVLKPKDVTILAEKYLYYFFLTLNIPNTGYNRHYKYLKDTKIPLPPLPEQQKIASILDAADNLRQKDQQLIEKYTALSQSLFLEMFGDPVSNKKKFISGTIRDLVSEVKYGTSSKAEDNGDYPYLRMNNITYQGDMDFESLKYINIPDKDKAKYVVKKGDILFNRTNSKELVGKTGLYNEDVEMIIAGYLIRVRANELANPYYIWAYLNSIHGKLTLTNMCKSIVGMANINAQELQDIKILIPPINIQDQFAERIQEIEAQKQLAIASLEKSAALFNSLLQRAFKGELTT